MFNGDFETSDLSQWYLVQQCAPGRLKVYTATSQPTWPAPDEGTYAARFHVLPTDVSPCTPTNNPRAQIATGTILVPGTEYWESFDVYFPASFPDVPTTGWYLFQEDYGDPYNGSPPLGFDIADVGGAQTMILARDQYFNYDHIWTAPLVKDHWYRFKVHKLFATDSTGFIEFWVDGAQQTFTDGSTRFYTPTMHPDSTGNQQFYLNSYFQVGMWSNAVDTYFDNGKIATSEAGLGP